MLNYIYVQLITDWHSFAQFCLTSHQYPALVCFPTECWKGVHIGVEKGLLPGNTGLQCFDG